MVPTMVADYMSSRDECASDLRLLPDEPSQHEEGSLHVVPGEHIRQLEGVGIIGPVVVGQCDVGRAAWQSDEAVAIDLRRRPHGLEASPGCHSGDRDSTESFGEHLHDFSNRAPGLSCLYKRYSLVIWTAFSETMTSEEGSNCQAFVFNRHFLRANELVRS